MKRNVFAGHKSRLKTVGLAAVMLPVVVGCQTTAARAQTSTAHGPNLSITAAQFPKEDAVILRWEQDWIMEKDGTVHRRDHKWMKLFNGRPTRSHGDPRIPFLNGHDELIIHKAQTILQDGTILPVPDYSFNVAGPDDVAGWPEYANWQDRIVNFSGIEDNAILELDYEIVTAPGVFSWISGDIRLDHDYPVVQRVISVTIPESTTLAQKVDRLENSDDALQTSTEGGLRTYRWTFNNLPGAPGEPQSLPWKRRCPRLRFTTCRGADHWVATILDRVNAATKVDERITEFAEEVIKDEADPAERVHKLAKKLHDSFNVVASPKTLRSFACRTSGEVFRSNYGNPLEAAAMYAAVLQSVGIDTSLTIDVDATTWDDNVPTESALGAVIVTASLPGESAIHVHPQQGVFSSPGHRGQRWLLNVDTSGKLQKTYVYAHGEQKPSELTISGKITIDPEGKAAGELRLRLTGTFYDPDKLDTAEAQKDLVTKMAGEVLTGFDVPSSSVVTLSDEVFRATAEVATEGELKHYANRHVLRLGDGPAFLADIHLPLNQSSRRTDVLISSRLREQIDLVIEIPEKWSVLVAPTSPGTVEGPWGRVSQSVEVDGQTLRFHRAIVITAETISPEDFIKLREAINSLRTEQSLVLVSLSQT